MKIILINGKKRAGKDFFGSLLQNELLRVGKTTAIMSFADPMKEILSTSLDIPLETFEEFKNAETPIFAGDTQVSNFRSFIQRFGTDAMQFNFGERVWANLLENKAKNAGVDFVIVPDFRFDTEQIPGALTIKVINDDIVSTDTHISENQLKDFKFDVVVDNTGKPDLTEDAISLAINILNNETLLHAINPIL